MRRHGASVRAVLFYGSCLRDGDDRGKVIDLYLIVDNCRAALGHAVSAFFCRLLPPNVYYLEANHEGRTVRAKYAVISLDQFLRGVSGGWRHPYLWARFAQPTAIVAVADEEVRDRLVRALAQAVRTIVRETLALLPAEFDSRMLWSHAFQESYRTELRSEGPERATQIADAFAERYRQVTEIVLREATWDATPMEAKGQRQRYANTVTPGARHRCERHWKRRRIGGKVLSVLRLIKAAFTFRGGPSYLAWKIERHSGIKVELSPWHERHPILASGLMFWRLYKKGAFR